MTLSALPPWMLAQVTTATSVGAIKRLTMLWSRTIMYAEMRTGWMQNWGRLAWPPLPMMVTLNESAAVMNGPDVMATFPARSLLTFGRG